MAHYAIAKGRIPGVYATWNEAKKQIDGFKYAKYRKFETAEEAHAFVKEHSAPPPSIVKQLAASETTLVSTRENEEASRDGLVVFTDGSAIGNGKKSAKAGYAAVFPNHPHLTCAKPLEGTVQTNNRAEFMACIYALEAADTHDPERRETLHVYTDSQLLINTVTKWMSGWKRKGWKKSTGDPIMNQDLVERLDALLSHGRKVTWTHVEAHTGKSDWMSTWNDTVDKMARGVV